MEAIITRSEAMKIIDSGEFFDLEFVTADVRRGTGGDYISVKNWEKLSGEPAEEAIPGEKKFKKKLLTKDPNHDRHKTFLVYNPSNRSEHPIKVHFRLIQYLNGKRIING